MPWLYSELPSAGISCSIAFKVMAAGAIFPADGIRYAFKNRADFVCAGVYDFQMVEDVNIACEILKSDLKRDQPWYV
jgi:hypothetical protein